MRAGLASALEISARILREHRNDEISIWGELSRYQYRAALSNDRNPTNYSRDFLEGFNAVMEVL